MFRVDSVFRIGARADAAILPLKNKYWEQLCNQAEVRWCKALQDTESNTVARPIASHVLASL